MQVDKPLSEEWATDPQSMFSTVVVRSAGNGVAFRGGLSGAAQLKCQEASLPFEDGLLKGVLARLWNPVEVQEEDRCNVFFFPSTLDMPADRESRLDVCDHIISRPGKCFWKELRSMNE